MDAEQIDISSHKLKVGDVIYCRRNDVCFCRHIVDRVTGGTAVCFDGLFKHTIDRVKEKIAFSGDVEFEINPIELSGGTLVYSEIDTPFQWIKETPELIEQYRSQEDILQAAKPH